MRARATGADRAAPLGKGRGGGGTRGGRNCCLSGGVGARAAPLGWTGPIWAELRFSIFLEFLIAFLFYFSRVFNSNSNQVSNSN
jgi:hypothetical protein